MWLLAQTDVAGGASGDLAGAADGARGVLGGALHGDPDAIGAVVQMYLLPVVWAVVILVVAWIVAGIANRMVRRSMERARVEPTLSRFFGKAAFYTIVTLGVVFALSKFGIDVTTFAAILAAVGFAIGMAMSGSLSNLAAGVMLLIFRPFRVGQYISAAGVSGTVDEIDLFSTTLDTGDNRRIIIPNSSVFGTTIENVSHHPERRLDVAVRVSYAADIDRTREVLGQAVATIDETIPGEGRGSAVVLGDLGESAVGWTVRVWLKAGDYWSVKEKLTRAIKVHLEQAGIEIAAPRMTVHVERESQ